MNKTTEGLRDILFDELECFLTGKVDSEHVRTVTKATGAILATVAKDLEAAKLLHDMNAGKDRPRTIADLNLNLLLSKS
jgi:hypothetical protein